MVKIVFLTPFERFSQKKEFSMKYKKGDTFMNIVKTLLKRFGNDFKKTLLNDKNKIKERSGKYPRLVKIWLVP